MYRREFFKRMIQITGLSVAYFNSFFNDQTVLASESNDGPPAAFKETLTRLFGSREITPSRKIKLKAPYIAENGAVVPITISSPLENISKLYILVEDNPSPLNAEFTLSPVLDVFLKARIKMAADSHVVIIAETRDKLLLSTKQRIKVSKGGCGG